MGSLAAVHQDLVEHGVKQVSILKIIGEVGEVQVQFCQKKVYFYGVLFTELCANRANVSDVQRRNDHTF